MEEETPMTDESKSILDETILWRDEQVTLREAIDSLPGSDGWWKPQSGEVLMRAAVMLGEKGLTPKEIAYHLYDVYVAVSACYGD